MANFKQDILEAVGEEKIEAIEILEGIGHFYGEQNPRDVALLSYHGAHSPEVILPLLDYEYDDGFGGMDCHDILVWTATKVFYVREYDGSTGLRSVKRNP